MGLPIRRIDFVAEHDLVLSMDSRVLKVWSELNGKPFAAIEPGTGLADFCRYPNSGSFSAFFFEIYVWSWCCLLNGDLLLFHYARIIFPMHSLTYLSAVPPMALHSHPFGVFLTNSFLGSK